MKNIGIQDNSITLTPTNKSIADEINPLSEKIIPAIPGEFYSYSSNFSKDKPLYFMMKCKANKNRSITTNINHIAKELDLTFIFGNQVILCSPNSTPSARLLEETKIQKKELNFSEIRRANIKEATFYDCFHEKEASYLVEIFNNSGKSQYSVVLTKGLVLAIKTNSGKYGLLHIEELTSTACKINACHILL